MTIKYKIILFILFISTSAAFSQVPEKPAIKVLARSLQDKVLLRWAPDMPHAWKNANEIGYYIERTTISRNGEAVLPLEAVILNQTPLKPAPLEEWETMAKADNNAAVLAQALYGDDFEVSARVALDAVMAANDEQEQRFTFGLLAAEQNYEAAKLAGLGFEDKTVIPGERYLYRIKIAMPEAFQIEDGSVYAGTDMYEELPKPVDFVVIFGDKEAQISWNFSLLKNTYSSYQVERSEDGNRYEPLNAHPIFNAEKDIENPELSLFMADSIPNKKTFYYRVKGITSFGETGPPTDPVKGQARELLKYNPHITFKDIIDDRTAVIEWEFPEEGESKITGFELRRANAATGTYKTVREGLPPQTRKVTYDKLKRVNYFKVVAMGNNGKENPSFEALIQPVDSIPPEIPQGLKGSIDTAGVVKLQWEKNIEPDLGGYRVYRANNKDAEFAQITNTVYTENAFTDTINVKNLNKYMYYKVLAEDQRYNASGFSEVLTIEKPDLTPPSAPVIRDYNIARDSVVLHFIPSSSKDVEAHMVYRKEPGVMDNWEQLAVLDTLMANTYIDKTTAHGKHYSYTITARDRTGLESTPATPVTLRTQRRIIAADAIRFSGTPNRELRFITLSWNVKAKGRVIEYNIYRAVEGKQLKLFKTVAAGTTRFEDNELEINTRYHYGLQVVTQGGVLSEIKEIEVVY